MKNQIIVLLLLAGLTLCSCMKTVHTHQQVMQSFRNRDEVALRFGMPDEIMVKNGVAGWLYICDTVSNRALASRATNDQNYKFTNDSTGLRKAMVSQFSLHKRYMVFSFNQHGDVLAYSSRGVNIASKKNNTLGTVLLVTGLATVSAAIIFAATFRLDFSGLGGY